MRKKFFNFFFQNYFNILFEIWYVSVKRLGKNRQTWYFSATKAEKLAYIYLYHVSLYEKSFRLAKEIQSFLSRNTFNEFLIIAYLEKQHVPY